jgi:hypothetical protein
MPEVNGNMVPPFGAGQDPKAPQEPKRTIKFEKLGPKVKPQAFELGKSQLKHDDKDKAGASLGSKERLGGGKAGGGRGAISREIDGCKVTMYLHCAISTEGPCEAGDVSEAINQVERAAELLSGHCKCLPAPPGMRYIKQDGCTLETKIIWHPAGKKSTNSGVIDLRIVCLDEKQRKKRNAQGLTEEGGAVAHGWGDSKDFTIFLPSPYAMSTLAGDNRPPLYAHEIGHVAFGTGSMAPTGWGGGHNLDEPFLPDDVMTTPRYSKPLASGRKRGRGLMRDTESKKHLDLKGEVIPQGLRGPTRTREGDKLSENEVCILLGILGCKMDECCPVEEVPKEVALIIDEKKKGGGVLKGSVPPTEHPNLIQVITGFER